MIKKPYVKQCQRLAYILFLWTAQTHANATFQKDKDLFINIGIATRLSYANINSSIPGSTDTNYFAAEEARLYTYGKLHKNVTFGLNLGKSAATDSLNIMDLYLGYELNDHFNVWLGRMLPPASRASSAAPLYSTTFDFPIAEQAPNLFSGRDNGATLWGTFAEQKLKYMLGGFQGHQSNIASQADNPFVATRLQYNFWDTEPGFYNMASYDGSKSILSIGGSVRYQKDGAATAVKQGDYLYWNMDGRLEKPLANGAVVGAEASYYNYNNDHTLDGSAPAGSGYFILASYMFPKKIGIGYIQPRADYQAFSNASNEVNTHRYELGAGYLLDGSNIRVDLFYFNESRNQNLPDNNGIKLIFHLVHFF